MDKQDAVAVALLVVHRHNKQGGPDTPQQHRQCRPIEPRQGSTGKAVKIGR
ncbi:MAG: hypothetical protein BWZ07_02969 [Alphaproteobacteria bacterium ADurb.BinA280]|nr:MAG: hypothetical protein BWZ07_02969 [Alphaproteobacteria bacterium ADurb.BinA280]